MSEWLMLIASLPATTKTPRMRVWRALKASGAEALRDGVYLLPAREDTRSAFMAQAKQIAVAGGTAHVLPLNGLPRDEDRAFRRRFDRSQTYARLIRKVQTFGRGLGRTGEGEVRRRLATLRRECALLQAIDYFPGPARGELESALAEAESAVNVVFSPDEPKTQCAVIQVRQRSQYQHRLWATRRRLWIDRVCSAWLIRRFIDPRARFVWIANSAKCPRNALGFDFDGATFTHMDGRVTFEVLVASFGLEQDAALLRIGALVHYLDVGGTPVAEAAGLETLMAGLRATNTSDDQILAVMSPVLNGLYAGYAPSKDVAAPRRARRRSRSGQRAPGRS